LATRSYPAPAVLRRLLLPHETDFSPSIPNPSPYEHLPRRPAPCSFFALTCRGRRCRFCDSSLGNTFGAWKVARRGPSARAGARPLPADCVGGVCPEVLVNSVQQGDDSTGTLTATEFKISGGLRSSVWRRQLAGQDVHELCYRLGSRSARRWSEYGLRRE